MNLYENFRQYSWENADSMHLKINLSILKIFSANGNDVDVWKVLLQQWDVLRKINISLKTVCLKKAGWLQLISHNITNS